MLVDDAKQVTEKKHLDSFNHVVSAIYFYVKNLCLRQRTAPMAIGKSGLNTLFLPGSKLNASRSSPNAAYFQQDKKFICRKKSKNQRNIRGNCKRNKSQFKTKNVKSFSVSLFFKFMTSFFRSRKFCLPTYYEMPRRTFNGLFSGDLSFLYAKKLLLSNAVIEPVNCFTAAWTLEYESSSSQRVSSAKWPAKFL